jgi:hypothetical protein
MLLMNNNYEKHAIILHIKCVLRIDRNTGVITDFGLIVLLSRLPPLIHPSVLPFISK